MKYAPHKMTVGVLGVPALKWSRGSGERRLFPLQIESVLEDPELLKRRKGDSE